MFGIKLIILRSDLNVASFWILTLISSAWVVFHNFLLIDATDRSKIRSDQKRLFFTKTPFKKNRILDRWTHVVDRILDKWTHVVDRILDRWTHVVDRMLDR